MSLFVWAFTFDLSSLGDPASSYATAGLAVSVNFNVNFNALLDKYTVSGIPRGGVWGVQPPPEIPKISAESSIA